MIGKKFAECEVKKKTKYLKSVLSSAVLTVACLTTNLWGRVILKIRKVRNKRKVRLRGKKKKQK